MSLQIMSSWLPTDSSLKVYRWSGPQSVVIHQVQLVAYIIGATGRYLLIITTTICIFPLSLCSSKIIYTIYELLLFENKTRCSRHAK